MKKLPYFVVGILILSTFAILGISTEASAQQEKVTLSFSDLEVVNSVDQFVEINYDGADGRFYNPSQPVLPKYSKTITLPFGIQVTGAECQISQIQTKTLNNKIVPAPTPLMPSIDDESEVQYIMDSNVYESNELFPNYWFDYTIGVGLDENSEHKSFLTINAYPVRYSPGNDLVEYVEDLEVTVTYSDPQNDPFPSTQTYELVIIAPQEFSGELQKLVNHKNSMGMQTTLKTTQEIYSEYSGFDKPEKIKYFIKDALETYDNQYVLLVGGLNSLINGKPRDDKNQGTKDWHVPVRYTNNRETGGTYDPGFISDLYYADIYEEGGVFCSWDSNDDGIYAKWSNTPGKDVIDFLPDVYVGRLACRNTYEVKIMVNKIVNYEKTPAGSWYDTMILCGGDSFDGPGYEGEVVCERIANDYMNEYNLKRMYASNQNSNPSMTPEGSKIIKEFTKGCGHIFFDGHASPMTWTTHWPDSDEWTERLTIYDFWKILNFRKLPILTVEGCHNSQFNVSVIQGWLDKDNSAHMWSYGALIPECWSWWIVRKIGGGSMSSIGNTGLGYGAVGEHGDLDNDGILEDDILEKYGGFYFDQYYLVFDQGVETLGQNHGGALTNYANTHPGMDGQVDAKTLSQMTLLGDPSLKLGGYDTGNNFRAEIIDAAAGVIGAPSENVILQATAYNGQGDVTYTWDFDNDGVYDDAEGEIASYSWDLPGVYWASVKATDENDNSDYYDTIVGIEIGAGKPVKPTGETDIKSGVTYEYSTNVNTQSGYWNKVYYKFAWGDGTESEWTESNTATHSWKNKGFYQIKSKAMLTHESGKDPNDFEDVKETDWSDPLTVKLPRARNTHPTFMQLLQNFFEKFPNILPLLQYLFGL